MSRPHDSDNLRMPDIVRREAIYAGRKINVEKLIVRPPGGREAVREVVRHPGAVVLLPLTADGRVVFERNVRVSVGQVLLELPAGTLEKGEPPADCAARELIEETGYRAGRIEKLVEFYTSPGVLDELIVAFVATELTAGPTALDVGEQLETELVDYDQAIALCAAGEIRDAKSIATLLTYHLRDGQGRKR